MPLMSVLRTPADRDVRAPSALTVVDAFESARENLFEQPGMWRDPRRHRSGFCIERF
jgi:hypothetical protein